MFSQSMLPSFTDERKLQQWNLQHHDNFTNILQGALFANFVLPIIKNSNCKYRKLCKTLWYKKAARKMLLKFTPVVNFTSISWAVFALILSFPVNGTVRLMGTYLLNSLTGLKLTGLLVNRTPCCPDIKFCVLHSR